MILRIDPAPVTHLDHSYRLWIGKHGVIACELFHDFFDGRFHPKQGAAFDAGKGFLFVEDRLGKGRVGQVKLRCERDRLFGADVRAEPALQAGVFLEP